MTFKTNIHRAALLLSVLILISGAKASATVTVTGASGGSSLSADTAANASAPAWTTLGAITIAEGANDDFAADTNVTLVLNAPAGFEFNTAVIPDITFTAGNDITSVAVAVTDANTIILTLTVSGTNSSDTLTLGSTTGIQVQPTAGWPLASGKHIYCPSTGGGTATIAGIITSADGSDGSDFGDLTEVAGTPISLGVETAADGSGTLLPAQSVGAGSSITAYAVARDAFGNFVDNLAADPGGWSLTNISGGVASGDLVPAGDLKSAVFTGHLVGSASILATSGALTATDSGLLTVVPAAANQLVIATQPSSTAVAGVPFAQQPVIYIEDQYGNLRTSDTLVVTAERNGGAGALLGTTSIAAVGGVATFTNLAHPVVSSITINFFSGSLTLATSQTINVNAGPFSQLQVLLPGETTAPGTTIGKIGTPNNQTAGVSYTVTVNAVDANWNLIITNDTVHLLSTDGNATLPADTALASGTQTFSVTNKTAGSWTLTASDATHAGITASSSASVTVNAGAFTKLQLLMPGETAAPGTDSGMTGSPVVQNTDNPLSVTVNAVDANWNLANTASDTVGITTSDPNAVLPPNAALSGGTQTFSVKFNTAGGRTVTATDTSDGSKSASTSPSITVNAGTFVQLQLLLPGETSAPGTTSGKTGTPTPQTAGTAYSVTVNAVDANWNVVSTNDTVAVTSTDANAILPPNTALVGGTTTLSVTDNTAGPWTLTASDTTHTGVAASTSASFAVNPGAFTKLQLLMPGETAAPGTASGKTGTPTAQTAGTACTVTVNAVDANWNLLNSVSHTVGITSSDVNATLPTNAALAAGTQTFSVQFNTTGSWTVTATDITDGSKAASTSPSITVNPGALVKLQLLMPGETAAPGTPAGKNGSPTAQTAGVSFSVTVKAVDASWNVISTNDTVQITSSDAQATLPANAALSGGAGTFSVALKTSGSQTVTASDVTHPGIGAATSAATTVSAAAASKLVIATPPSATATAGVPFLQQPVIFIEDQYGNLRSNDTLVVTATRSAGAGTLLGTTNVTAVGGVASFSDLAHCYATNITIQFGSGSLTAATSGIIAVNPAAYSQLLVLLPGETAAPATLTGRSGSPLPQAAGTAFTVEISAVDEYRNLVDTVTNLVGLSSSDVTAVLSTNALVNGTNTFSVTLGQSGSQTVTAHDLIDGHTTGTSSAVTVSAGVFTKLQLLLPGETATPGTPTGKTGTPTTQTAGAAYSVTVNAVDANWNVVNSSDTVNLASSDPNAGLPANAALAGGTVMLSLTNRTAGSWTITASDVTHPGIAADTSSALTINAGSLAKLQLVVPGETAVPGTASGKTGTPTPQTAGTAYGVTVSAVDANWNVVSTNDIVAVTSTDANAILPPNTALVGGSMTFNVINKTAGNWTLTASDTTHTGVAASTSASFTVNPGAFTKLQLLMPGETAAPGTASGKTGSPNAQTAGTAYTVIVNAVDANWNLLNSVSHTVGITSSDVNATLPPNAALAAGTQTFSVQFNTTGSWTVTATDITDGSKAASTSPSITVNPGALVKLQLLMPGETAAPGTPAGKNGSPTAQTAGASFSVTVKAVDASWNVISTNDTVQITSSDAQASLPANAALSGGGGTFSVALKTSGSQTVTASDVTHPGIGAATSAATTVSAAAASKLVIATPPSATATAGVPFLQQPVIFIEDQYGNLRSNDTLVVTATRSAGAGTLLGTTNVTAVGGVASFSDLAHRYATNITIQFGSGSLTAATSGIIAVNPAAYSQLLVLLPGETAAPVTPTGRTGTPTAQTLGIAFNVGVSAADAYGNLINTVTDVVGITSSDTTAILPANAPLINGANSFAVTLKDAGSQTVTASDITDGHTTGTSSAVTVSAGVFTRLQLLLPGETAAPWTTTGKTGTPTAQVAGTAFNVTVNGVDANWNLVNTNDTIKITSSDANATLPPNAGLVAGTRTFGVTLQTPGSSTVTASDLTHTSITASTSPQIFVGSLAPVLQGGPVVAIHDSELTRALETLPASGATPTGPGTTGFQWWPTNWHYFVMPDSVKEALHSDGTAFTVVGDSNITAGVLVTNGVPQYPILISLASEAVGDDEVSQLTNYVAAGGFLFVGSSAFTRNTDGTTRTNFALANAMGLSMVNPGLTNWAANSSFSKLANHPLVSHIPAGQLTWFMPSSSDEVSWPTAQSLTGETPTGLLHLVWQVQTNSAVVIAQGDGSPYLTVRQFGKGYFIYDAAMQPFLGHGGWAPGMYAYGILRNAIQWAFQSASLPVAKLSPWPYPYNAAVVFRHDMESIPDLIDAIESSAQFESAHGAAGDYFFCTGALRDDYGATERTNEIVSLQRAVSLYGATVASHNGGLTNIYPFSPALPNVEDLFASDPDWYTNLFIFNDSAYGLSPFDYDWWHWGPDEVLDVTNVPPGYSSGSAYAETSISNSFVDLQSWGLTNSSGWRHCVAPYFNATREASYILLDQLGVNTSGEQKLSPFPSWPLSTQTPDKLYGFLSLPVSDWFVGTAISQSADAGHTTTTAQQLVDYYYNLGALINLYCHDSAAGNAGQAPAVDAEYVTYSMNTNLHPRLWSANAASIYGWWLQRSHAQLSSVSYSTNGSQSIATLSITGATDPNTAVEILTPSAFSGVQVLANGAPLSTNNYRFIGNTIKLLVGTSVTNAVITYSLPLTAQDDTYFEMAGTALVVPAPGVLANDSAGGSGVLTASLMTPPAHGTLSFPGDGSFVYTPTNNFSGIDSFSYLANNGITNSAPAIVTVCVAPAGELFADDFTRPAVADPLAPWQSASGAWAITNGLFQGTSALGNYGVAYLTNSWTNYSVQAQIQFPAGAYGGGLGGCVNPQSGARYAAWVFPEGSSGGSNVLKLIKFQSWTSWGYTSSSYTPMQIVSLSGVGTNWHTVKLAFLGAQIAVYFDGNLVMSVTDVESQPYLSGGISADMWTDTTAYTMSVANVIVSPLVVADSYSVNENTTLTVQGPGPLANDTGVYGTNLVALLVNGPTNGTITWSSNGAFSYSPATNFAGADSFLYEANDGHANLGTAIVSITVNPAIIITANNQSRSYGAANSALTGSIVGLQNGDNITAIYSTVADTNSPVGEYPITIGLLDPDHKLANYIVTTNNGTLTVNPAALTVTANNQSKIYGAVNPALTGSLVGVQNNDPITASYSTLAGAASGVGTYPILASLSDPDQKLGNYSVSTDNGTLTVTPATLTVTGDPQSRTYGAANPVLTATFSGFANGDTRASAVTGAPSITTTATAASNTGSYPIVPALGSLSAANYIFSFVNGTLTVSPVGLTITANNQSKGYGAALPVLTVGYSGFVNGDTAAGLTTPPTVTTSGTASSPAGTYPITASGAVDANYTISYVSGTLTVSPVGLTITANDASRAYGATNPVFSASYAGFVNGDTNDVLSGQLVFNCNAQTNSPVGTYPIEPGGLTAANYSITFSNGTLTVLPYALTVTADNQSKTYGATNPVFNGTITGIQNGDNITATYATTATQTSPVSTYPITPTLVAPAGTLTNYTVSSTNGTLSVTAAGLTVVANNAARSYGAANPAFSGTITGIQNGDNITATYATTATQTSPVSTYPITPTLVAPAGTLTNYTVSSTNGTLSVTAAGLTVTANNASRAYGAANPAFSGTITGIQNGDNITATYATTATQTSPVSTYPITPTLVAPAGTLTNYTVSSTNGTLSVTAAGLTVVANNAARSYGATNPGFSGTITGIQNGDNITATYATTATQTSPVSTYPITPTLVAPAGTLTNYTVSSTNGTLSVTAAGLTVVANDAARSYGAPNPVFSGTITGIQNGDNITATYATTATQTSPVSTYPITPTLVAPAGTLTNYTVSSTNGTLSVTAAGLTVVANNAARSYGAPNPGFSGTITGIQNGDNITATYATTATQTSPVSTYPITPTLVAPAGTLTNYTVSSTNGTLSVTAAGLTVTANNASRAYGAANPVFNGTLTGIQNGDNITATYATTATVASPVSTYPITPTLVAPAGTLTNYTVSSTNGTLSVTAAGLTVVANDALRSYGATNPGFNGTLTGIQNGDNITATYATTATVASPVSTYPITPTLVAPAGTLTNYTVSSTNGTLSVTAAGLTVVANNASRSYGAPNPGFSGTITGIQNGDNITATYATTATQTSPVSTYPITPTLVAPAGTLTNYTVSSTNGTLSVTAAGLTVTANNASRAYGAANPAFSGTITGIQNGDNITATYATTATQTSPVSTYPITPTLVAPAGTLTNYTVSSTNGTLSVTAAGLTVVANNAARSYGATNPGFSGTITGIQNGDNITATYATTATQTSPVSTYPITPTLVAPAGTLTNYTVSSTNGTLSVTAAGLTVVANNAARSYGATNPGFSGTITGIQNGDNITATYATTATQTSPVSTYPITPTLVAPAGTLTNYTVSSTNGTLTVGAAGLTVVANDASRAYGAANPVFNGTITGIQNGDNITATYATTATVASPVSTYPITPTLVAPAGTLTNYTVSSTNGTLSVTAAGLTVVANNAARSYGAANPAFSGTITGIQNGDNITATYATTATQTSPVSTYPITPTLVAPAGTLTNYTVSSTNGTLSVTAAGLTVTANNASRAYGAANPAFSGTITGIQNGDNITATYATTATQTSPVSTYPITPTLVAPAGTLTNYTVSSTNGTLSVTAAGLTVVANDAARSYGAPNPVFSGTITGIQNGDNITATYATTATQTSPVSTYPITPTLVAPAGTLTNYTVSSTNGTLSVTAAGLTVVANNASRSYGATNPGFSGTITGIQNGDNITATYATTATQTSPVSTYPITPTLVAPAGTLTNYTVSSTNGTLSVTAAGLTVVANNASRSYGAPNPGFSGTITGIQNGDNITATYATTATQTSPVSTYPITPTLVAPAGTLTNYTVSSTNGTLTVGAAGLTVVANDASRAYGAANPVFNGTITGIQNGDNITATYATTATVASPVSTYPITPTLVAPAGTLTNYTVSSTNGTLSVTAAGLTVTANNASRAYGATNPAFSGTITGIQNGDNITATYATTATQTSPVSTYPITPTLVAPAGTLTNYTVSSTNGTLSVTAAGLTVVANNAARSYGATNPGFSGTITGIQNGDNITATYATTATQTSPVSTYPITPTLVAPAGTLTNYTVSSTNGTLSVTAAGLTVVANDAARSYGAPNPVFSGTITGIQNGDNITATYATTATQTSPVSTYPITPTLVAPAGTLTNYTVSSTNGTLSVTAADLTVVANNASRSYGAPNPGFSGTITGIQNGDNITATYATTATVASPVSTYPITPTLVAAPGALTNYLVSSTNGTLSVTAAGLTVTANNASRAYGAANPAFSGTITGLQNGDNITATYATTATVASPVGTYPITPTLVDPGQKLTNYAVTVNSGTLTVTPAPLPTILSIRPVGNTSVVITWASVSSSVYRVQYKADLASTNWINLAPDVTATASTASFTDYPNGAPQRYYRVVLLSNLTPLTPLVVVVNNASRVYGRTNPAFSGTITGLQNGDNITATYATTATVASPVSTYPITPTLVDPNGKLANYSVTITNGTLTVTPAGLTVVANNASRTYGAANPVFSGTITGLQNNDSVSIKATYATTATVTSPVGPYPIIPTLVDILGRLDNYTVTVTNGTLTVGAAGLTVTANNASRSYGATNPVFSGTITGIQNGDNITATYATTATQTSPVSTYPITPTLVAPAGTLTNYTVSSTNGTLSVTAAGLSVVANNASRSYGAPNPVFSGTITGLQNGDNITATYATTATVASPVGTYPITPTLVDPGQKLTNYAVTVNSGTLTVTPAPLPTILSIRPVGNTSVVITWASVSSSVYRVQYKADLASTNWINLAPDVTATASTASFTDYPNGAPQRYYRVVLLLNVTPLTPLVVVVNNASRVYGRTNPAFSGTITGLQNGDNITATYATTATAASPVSTYPITPTLVDPNGKLANYSVTITNGTLTVTPAGLTVAANNASRSYGATNPVFNGTITGIQNGDNITATYATSATVTSPVSTYPIIPTLVDPGNKLANYTAFSTNGILTVGAAGLTVKANNASRTYGATNPVFSGTITGLQNGDNITASYATTATVASPVGPYPIAPTLVDPGNKLANYTVFSTNGILTVGAAGLTVKANNASRTYGATNPVFSGTITGIQNGDNITATYATTATVTSPVSTYPIIPTLVDPNGKLSNYTLSTTNGTLTVGVTGLTVTANNASRAYGAANPTFTGTITGIQNSDGITATYATTATISSPAGTYSIVPSLVDPGNKLPNYNVTVNDGTLTITAVSAPTILSIVLSSKTNIVITWSSVNNSVYRVQYKTNLASTNWISLTPDVTATGSTASYTDHPAGASQRYYRILLVSTTPQTPPVILNLVGAGTTNVVITWSALSNGTYHLQYKTNLASANWSDLSPNVTATGNTASFTDHPVGARLRFYRVALLP